MPQIPSTGSTSEKDEGQVCGVSTSKGGHDVDVDAPLVVIATGGFASDLELFEEFEGAKLVSAASKTSTGGGLQVSAPRDIR